MKFLATRVLQFCATLLLLSSFAVPVALAQCEAYAGTLLSDPVVQNADSSFTLNAFREENAMFFAGADVLYILSVGEERVVAQTDTVPNFVVTERGRYRIHTLLAELNTDTSANYIAPSELAADGRTVPDVVAAFGERCADLDEVGASFFIPTDFGVECTIAVGSLQPRAAEFSPDGMMVTLSATVARAPELSGDIDAHYLLAAGEDGVLIAAAAQPTFTVAATDTGLYTIYPLIAEVDDPMAANYLNLSEVDYGNITLDAFISDLVDRDICAQVGFETAQVYFPQAPTEGACIVESGELIAGAKQSNASMDTVTLIAVQSVAALKFSGQEQLYFLTTGEGPTIVAFSDVPRFSVTQEGTYTIHAAVIELSDTSSVNYVSPDSLGVNVRGVDSLSAALLQAGICASIDSVGASFTVTEDDFDNEPSGVAELPREISFSALAVAGTVQVRIRADFVADARLDIISVDGRLLASRAGLRLVPGDQTVSLSAPEARGLVYVRLMSRWGIASLAVMIR